jgi:hypothetical protein
MADRPILTLRSKKEKTMSNTPRKPAPPEKYSNTPRKPPPIQPVPPETVD